MTKSLYALSAALAFGVALYSLRFVGVPFNVWLVVGPEIRGVFAAAPLAMLAHTVVAPLTLLTGPFQFLPGLRQRRPLVHRWTGRVYAVSCLIAGTAAFAAALHASGGPIASLGFGTLAVLWVATTGGAWIAALNRNFALHRTLMRYSYAMTFGAVTLRLQIPLGIMLFHFDGYRSLSPWLSFTAWAPNVAAVWLYTRFVEARPRGVASLAG